MQIGWLIPNVDVYGSVREVVETSNVWCAMGHTVTIFHRQGGPCSWLPCQAQTAKVSDVPSGLDVLIGVTDWAPDLHNILDAVQVRLKIIGLLGVTPDDTVAAQLRGDKLATGKTVTMKAALHRYAVLPDGDWQGRWLRAAVGINNVLPGFGGINTQMFRPMQLEQQAPVARIGFSGDTRKRKGTDTVLAALSKVVQSKQKIEFDHYWGKGLRQDQMAEFISSFTVWVDGQRWAGWNNVIAEPMACRVPVICTDIQANGDIAENNKTAVVVPVDDVDAMTAAVLRVLDDAELRHNIAKAGLDRIRKYDYGTVARSVMAAIEERMGA